jgi:hypothetical protein
MHATFMRDHEYKRHGTVSLLAGIDPLTGKVHALVRDRHRSRELACHSTGWPPRVHLHTQARLWLNLIEGFFSKFARSVLRLSEWAQTRRPDMIRTKETLA